MLAGSSGPHRPLRAIHIHRPTPSIRCHRTPPSTARTGGCLFGLPTWIRRRPTPEWPPPDTPSCSPCKKPPWRAPPRGPGVLACMGWNQTSTSTCRKLTTVVLLSWVGYPPCIRAVPAAPKPYRQRLLKEYKLMKSVSLPRIHIHRLPLYLHSSTRPALAGLLSLPSSPSVVVQAGRGSSINPSNRWRDEIPLADSTTQHARTRTYHCTYYHTTRHVPVHVVPFISHLLLLLLLPVVDLPCPRVPASPCPPITAAVAAAAHHRRATAL